MTKRQKQKAECSDIGNLSRAVRSAEFKSAPTYVETPPLLHARAGLLRKLLEMKKSLGSPGFALPFDVSRLISRGLGLKWKNMRKALNVNDLQNTTQVLDVSVVRTKNGRFSHHFSPLTTLISRELRRKWQKNKIRKVKRVTKVKMLQRSQRWTGAIRPRPAGPWRTRG
jgi:hypothetical protein